MVTVACAGTVKQMVGVAPEQERKLLQTPRGVGILAADVRAFERERGVPVREVLVGQDEFLKVLRLVGLAGLVEVRVRLEREMRDGYVILVG